MTEMLICGYCGCSVHPDDAVHDEYDPDIVYCSPYCDYPPDAEDEVTLA